MLELSQALLRFAHLLAKGLMLLEERCCVGTALLGLGEPRATHMLPAVLGTL